MKTPACPCSRFGRSCGRREKSGGNRVFIGYPVMVKQARGGGRGIRIARTPEELETAFTAARQEAIACFGDGSIYLEKFLQNPRHIEIQVLADEHGNVIHLGERDCSCSAATRR